MYNNYFEFLIYEAFDQEIKDIKDAIEIEYKNKLSKELELLNKSNATKEDIQKARQENAKEKGLKQKEAVKLFLNTKSKDEFGKKKYNVFELTNLDRINLEKCFKVSKLKDITLDQFYNMFLDTLKKHSISKDYSSFILTWWKVRSCYEKSMQN